MTNTTEVQHSTVQFILYRYFLYENSPPDILINYCLIILFTFLNNWYPEDFGRSPANLHSLIFFVLQILCWVTLDAYGVSLVWSGQLGLTFLLLLDWVRNRERQSSLSSPALRGGSALLGVLAIAYYAYWFPAITTVAHLLALLLGLLLALAFIVCRGLHRLKRLSKLDD